MKLGFIIKSLFLISSSFFLHCSEMSYELQFIFEFNSCYYESSAKILSHEKKPEDVVFDLNKVFTDFLNPATGIKFGNMQMSGEFNADIIKGKKLKFSKCYIVRNILTFETNIKNNEKVDLSNLTPLTNLSFDGTKVTIEKTVAQDDNVAILFTLEIENSNDNVVESGCCCCKRGKNAEDNKDNS